MKFKDTTIPVTTDMKKKVTATENTPTQTKPTSPSEDWWQSNLYPDSPRHSDR